MLDIGVGDAPYQASDPDEPSLGFEGDDGYYWFLHPLFERLAAETGQYIDLYGCALFAGPDLTALTRMLADARRLVEAQAEAWEVQTAVVPVLHRRVGRGEFLRLLSTWERAASRAQESGRAVICFGD
ncbi:hypothetical protein GobsT_37300 [Gemmata obscuriglobus]|uniref:DUF1877 domain-containing protein n=1 Tax=Gemmata obscuriglobus TaxID=114 RepID=A0A2Z3H3K6_9BACT|nr:hypothetical protein [Gemmata obscuriglobus]AWM38166.1 hypothetical protein C1280_15000 [Gemmata obscuriglobus]QEG28941.1 hypothetical protein GobsT_37300 [Gemmata obscuriglobus]VTS07457.1 unnamed protein product [Gemmata obscuriglobus UQM 2246]